jgi:hypothetical protein
MGIHLFTHLMFCSIIPALTIFLRTVWTQPLWSLQRDNSACICAGEQILISLCYSGAEEKIIFNEACWRFRSSRFRVHNKYSKTSTKGALMLTPIERALFLSPKFLSSFWKIFNEIFEIFKNFFHIFCVWRHMRGDVSSDANAYANIWSQVSSLPVTWDSKKTTNWKQQIKFTHLYSSIMK